MLSISYYHCADAQCAAQPREGCDSLRAGREAPLKQARSAQFRSAAGSNDPVNEFILPVEHVKTKQPDVGCGGEVSTLVYYEISAMSCSTSL